jgi:U3 small nucleolar ribonucleoprotein protein IMP3
MICDIFAEKICQTMGEHVDADSKLLTVHTPTPLPRARPCHHHRKIIIMVRKLKHHEQKLLKKVDFLAVRAPGHPETTPDPRAVEAGCKHTRDQGPPQIPHTAPGGLPQVSPPAPSLSTTHLPRYNKLCGALRSYAHRLSMLPAQDPFRAQMEGQLLSKLYDIGVLTSQAKLSDVDNRLTVAAFCRRRLAVFMCMSKMAETVSAVRTLLVHIPPMHTPPRPPSSSNRATSVSAPTQSLIPPFSSQGTSFSLHCTFPLILSRHMEDFVTWVDTSKLKRTVMAYNDEVSPSVTSPISLLTGSSSTTSICCEHSVRCGGFASPSLFGILSPLSEGGLCTEVLHECQHVVILCSSISVFTSVYTILYLLVLSPVLYWYRG